MTETTWPYISAKEGLCEVVRKVHGRTKFDYMEISLFKNAEVGFTKMLSKCIKPILVLQGEYVMKKYDMGSEMYFIHRGVVDVVSVDGSIVLDTLRAGASCGEVALLFSCPRTASIRARVNTDVFCLTKQDLDQVLDLYPKIKDQVIQIAEERRQMARRRSAAIGITLEVVAEEPEETELLEEDATSSATHEGNVELIDEVAGSQPRSAEDNFNSNNQEEDCSEDEEVQEPVCRTLVRRIKELNQFTVNPRSRQVKIFTAVVCLFGVISTWILVYQAAFQDHHAGILTLNYTLDAFFIIEIFLKFHMSYFDNFGVLMEDCDVVYQNYLWSLNGFCLDLTAALPLDIFALTVVLEKRMQLLSYLRLIHALRIVRVSQFFSAVEKELNINMLMVRLCKFFVALTLLIHFSSCIWYGIACPQANCSANSWAKKIGVRGGMPGYCASVYWCVATMTSTGYGDIHAHTVQEMLFASVVMVAGKLMFGFILGNIASTLANEEAQKIQYIDRLDAVENAMNDQLVPQDLQVRVMDYLTYMWKRNKGKPGLGIFRDAPECMVAEICLAITKDMLDSIPLLKGVEAPFLRTLCQKVTQQFYMPGDYIVREGDLIQELCYIQRGVVDMIESGADIVTNTLEPGSIFGEVGLLLSLPSQVTLRAKTHVDLLCLSCIDLQNVLTYYPIMKAKIQTKAKQQFGEVINASELKSNPINLEKHKHKLFNS